MSSSIKSTLLGAFLIIVLYQKIHVKYTDPAGQWAETAWDIASIAMGVASFTANIVAGNYGDAALDAAGVVADAVATAVPFIPGGAGTAIKAKRIADTALDLKKVKQNPCGCFAAGTLLLTPDGQQPIETLRVGDLLAAKDETTGDIDWKPITQLHI